MLPPPPALPPVQTRRPPTAAWPRSWWSGGAAQYWRQTARRSWMRRWGAGVGETGGGDRVGSTVTEVHCRLSAASSVMLSALYPPTVAGARAHPGGAAAAAGAPGSTEGGAQRAAGGPGIAEERLCSTILACWHAWICRQLSGASACPARRTRTKRASGGDSLSRAKLASATTPPSRR